MKGRGVFSAAIVVLALGMAGAIVIGGTRRIPLWLSQPLIDSEPPRPVDAIVVLGAGTYNEATLGPQTAYRLLHGLQLLRGGYAPVLIACGGSHHGTRISDAGVMANVAAELGLSRAALILDGTPVSTRAQATSVADISTRRGIKSVALVTSPLHSYRAARAFRKAGVTVVSTPGVAAAPSILLVAQDHFFG